MRRSHTELAYHLHHEAVLAGTLQEPSSSDCVVARGLLRSTMIMGWIRSHDFLTLKQSVWCMCP
jgi:hypothetical protein